MRKLLAALLFFVCASAFGQNAQLISFTPTGKAITFTANTSGNIPTPVQAVSNQSPAQQNQYLVVNTGVNLAFISYATTSATATTNCVVPTGTSQPVVPVLAGSAVIFTTAGQAFFCGITSSGTSIVYVVPGNGL